MALTSLRRIGGARRASWLTERAKKKLDRRRIGLRPTRWGGARTGRRVSRSTWLAPLTCMRVRQVVLALVLAPAHLGCDDGGGVGSASADRTERDASPGGIGSPRDRADGGDRAREAGIDDARASDSH